MVTTTEELQKTIRDRCNIALKLSGKPITHLVEQHSKNNQTTTFRTYLQKSIPYIKTILRFCKFTNVSLSFILGGKLSPFHTGPTTEKEIKDLQYKYISYVRKNKLFIKETNPNIKYSPLGRLQRRGVITSDRKKLKLCELRVLIWIELATGIKPHELYNSNFQIEKLLDRKRIIT